ncbi:MAG: hypothetical protein KA955_10430 [Prevotella sp.]|jgi:DNA repair protein RadC|nr:hypothetical protein [Prevotella sp.]
MALIFQTVLLANTSSLILRHNYPSGKFMRSKADDNPIISIKQITKNNGNWSRR